MTLNPDALREVLLCIENEIQYTGRGYEHNRYLNQGEIASLVDCKDITEDEIKTAVEILLTTNYLDLVEPPKFYPTGDLAYLKIKGLTMDGYNFLNTIRKKPIWEAVKKGACLSGVTSIKALSCAAAKLGEALLSDPEALNNFIQGFDNIKSIF